MRYTALVLALLACPALACTSVDGRPDPVCTPGAVDPRVTQENIHQTICVAGYSKTVRPPVSVTNRIKHERMQAYGLEGQPMQGYELDHKLPLSSGGCPDCVSNLWPQLWNGPRNAHDKDRLEDKLHRLVCQGKIPLDEAQKAIMDDWVAAYMKYVCADEAGGLCQDR